ncbi:nitroreductase [uncultured Tateyamaria sp.]|uniref:nitroreductase n=1 Tax=uncultured Tateyamaria sp. TaxID=455651 RepID=UPI0026216843|nr:nitroreductase [uncultured Tateyamaria sp.]
MSGYETLADLLRARYSCRAFLDRPVPKDDITRIIAAARHVPSWCNAQPWQLIITDGAATGRFRTALFEAASTTAPAPDLPWPESYPGIYGDRRRACGFQLYDTVGIEKGDRAASTKQMMENFSLFGAPHVAIVTAPRALGPYGAMDTGGFVTAFCLAAQALGVATIAQASVAAQGPFIRAHFDIPEDAMILCAISFGYADPDHPANSFRTTRAEVDDIVDWRT